MVAVEEEKLRNLEARRAAEMASEEALSGERVGEEQACSNYYNGNYCGNNDGVGEGGDGLDGDNDCHDYDDDGDDVGLEIRSNDGSNPEVSWSLNLESHEGEIFDDGSGSLDSLMTDSIQ